MPLDYHPEAVEEARDAFAYYSAADPAVAARFEAAYKQTRGFIARRPGGYPEVEPGFRSAAIPKFPYSVVYRELPGRVEILAVAHARRRPGYWRDRAA